MGLTRRQWLSMASGLALAPWVTSVRAVPDAAQQLYTRALVMDGLGFPGGGVDGQADLLTAGQAEDIAASGLDATHLTIGEVGAMAPLEAFEKIIRSATFWDAQIDRYPAILSRVRRAADISSAKAEGRTGLIYGLQDGVSFEDDLERLPALHHVGVRVIQPTYNRRNLLGDGCMEAANAGLSRTGREAIDAINELNILLDLSHCGRQTAADAIEQSRSPVSFTHTGCFALAEHPRHRTDEEIRAVADGGGVIGIFIMPYLARGRQPAAADVVRHLMHALNVAGEDAVCLGTDGSISPTVVTDEFREQFRSTTRRRKALGIAAPFETEEGYLFASDLNTPRRFETLSNLLLQQGLHERQVEKVLGANLFRLLETVWN